MYMYINKQNKFLPTQRIRLGMYMQGSNHGLKVIVLDIELRVWQSSDGQASVVMDSSWEVTFFGFDFCCFCSSQMSKYFLF